MELSGLAVVTDESLMERLPYRRCEGISPYEVVEGMIFVRSIPHVFDRDSLRSVQEIL